MFVRKRDGREQQVQFDKITARVRKMCYGLDPAVDPPTVSQKVYSGMYPGVTTQELDTLAAETAAYLTTEHPDYAKLAARLAVSDLHKRTTKSFSETMHRLHDHVDPATGERNGPVSKELIEAVELHKHVLDAAIIYDRDFSYDYFGFKTLERSYLLRLDGRVVERPQHMLMRVSIGIHGAGDLEAILETYHLMSERWFTHASPTLFNSGTTMPQMSSCFLLQMTEDSIEGIYDTLKRCALISKSAGGIGLSVHNVRATGSYIRGTNGASNGLIPMLRVFNDTARYVDQGGGKRKGAFAIYLEPWHADIEAFLDLRKNHGKEEVRARDLFYGLWTPDLFMRRVEADGQWSLFCPNQCPGLSDCHGAEFDALYERYEREGRAVKTLRAQELWQAVVEAQIETGTPYLLYKDACNAKSNQQHLGTLKSSNLCTEILEYTSPDEVAVCNLASIALPRFVVTEEDSDGADGDQQRPYVDHQKLYSVTYTATRNLNRIIDRNYYPIPEAERSNMRHRPIGLGVQGLADVLCLLRLPFDSDRARKVNRAVFETIYYAALDASCDLAKRDGPYETYAGSPASQGRLQPDLWGVETSTRWDWTGLRRRIAQHGLRNSLLTAPMPTASTSQILGCNECFEPFTSNVYSRRVLSGDFAVVNPYLLRDLQREGLWDADMRNEIIARNGSVQGIEGIPEWVRELYKTVWEIKQRAVIDMAADRGAFIDQSQSMNLFVPEATFQKLTSMHFYGWKKGLKTGMYYLRTRAAQNPIQFTVDQERLAKKRRTTCSLKREAGEECLACGS